ncbi:MAG: glycerol-3-phosphate 1-O-acyltransferase PlsY [Clostridiales bacterium]|nr:glycerol-3-phosphate 1-O-acyltransferase PlsY [Clostridiales bacterium]
MLDGLFGTLLSIALCAAASYLIGSINFSIIFSKSVFNKDIRKLGSGNAGSTNMLRNFGKRMGGVVFVCDILKGYLPLALVSYLAKSERIPYFCIFVSAVFIILGHLFPIFFGFKGGKGVATSSGIILATQPVLFPFIFLVMLVTVAATGYVSLGSVLCSAVYPAGALLVSLIVKDGHAVSWFLTALFMAVMVIFMHRGNIKRLINHEENKINLFKKKKGKKN